MWWPAARKVKWYRQVLAFCLDSPGTGRRDSDSVTTVEPG